jgi:hypothetical protein
MLGLNLTSLSMNPYYGASRASSSLCFFYHIHWTPHLLHAIFIYFISLSCNSPAFQIATYIPIYIHTLYLPNNYTSLFLIPWSSGHIPDQSMRRVFAKKNVMERLFLFSSHTPSNNLIPIDQIPSRMHLHNNDGYRIYCMQVPMT